MENEIRRLFQGIRDIEGTYICFLTNRHEVTQYRKVTYRRILRKIKPQKKETHRVRIKVGEKKIY